MASVSSGTTLINGGYATQSYISSLANPDLKWEKTAQFDFGVELGLWQNRLTLDVSYYQKNTTDLLLSCPVPYSSGFTSIYKNIGSVKNQGIDFMLNTRNIDTEDFGWNTTLSLNYNKNEITALGDTNSDILNNGFLNGNSILRVGESFGSFYGYIREGVYTKEDAAAGLCEDYQIGRAKRSKDRHILGKGLPDLTGSFINTLRYKNFDLTLDMQFVLGVETAQTFYHSAYDRFGQTNTLSDVLYDAYDGTNPTAMQQAIYLFNTGHANQDTMWDSSWVVDGSYLRCNLIQLGYTFSANQLKNTPLSNLRMYLNVNNAFLLTSSDFNGYDPESTSQGTSSTGQNITFFSYPRARTFTFGVNVAF